MTNKILLALIGAGLWANVVSTWIRPASGNEVDNIFEQAQWATMLDDIQAIATGTGQACQNPKICH